MVGTARTTTSNQKNRWIQQLVTQEDPYHVHKTLGITCLLNFGWRFMLHAVDPNADMGFQQHPHWTLPTILLHFLLNASSFEFSIPEKRISTGYRIWPQYRLHSMVFLLRSLAILSLTWYQSTFQIKTGAEQQQQRQYWWNLGIVLTTMLLGDAATATQKYPSHTIRQLAAPAVVKYYFSLMQFCATAMNLFAVQQRYAIHYYMVMIIQANAFLMTLRRKNLVSHGQGVALYGVALGAGLAMGLSEFYFYYHHQSAAGNNQQADSSLDGVCLISFLSCAAALWRMGPRFLIMSTTTTTTTNKKGTMSDISLWSNNKYFIWIAMALLLHGVLLPSMAHNTPMSKSQVYQMSMLSVVLTIAYGLYKGLWVVAKP